MTEPAEEITEELAADLHARAKADPVFHVVEIQGCDTMEEYQNRILLAIRDHERVAIKSCHDLGKTFSFSKVVLWFGSSFEDSKIITTAPTFNQVKRLLWSEIRSGWRKSKYPLGGEMLTTEWKIDDDWFALGFTSKGESGGGDGQGVASGFQGFHAKHILVLFDEATGIPHNIWTQLEGMMTSASVRFACIGNPTSRQTDFFKCFSDPLYHKIHLSCFDSPNMIANGLTNIDILEREIREVKSMNEAEQQQRLSSYKVVKPQLLSAKWCVSMGMKWGITHPLFVSKVIGEFPEVDDNVMISLGTVEASQRRWELHQEEKLKVAPTVRSIGVDCARYGPDKTVITMIEDHVQVFRKSMPKTSITEIVGEVTNLISGKGRIPREVISVDGTGLGGGVVDGLISNQKQGLIDKRIQIREVNNGASCDSDEDKKTYFNVKAHMFKLLADSMKDDLALMPESVYLEELPMVIYHFTPKGQLAIESKDDYKARTGLGSPDDSDALALANYGRVYTGSVGEFTEDMIPGRTRQKQIGTFATRTRMISKW